ncbi:MAG TPA: lamin tail domain-containing protein [Anaerolineales bacterium]|nr:lamin tail domain-containing protein [Anaerolineales bacterium]
MKQVNTFLATLRAAYLQQGQWGRILLPGSVVLVFCCICSLLAPVLAARNLSRATPSPVVLPGDGTLATPTSLLNFATSTPFPTATPFVPTPFPSLTSLPTGSPTSTQLAPTATVTPVPTDTAIPTQEPPTATATSVTPVMIISVDKAAEYVEIQNNTQAAINLRGWRLVSETGNQSCPLRGTLEPDEVLRIWARRGNPGFDCQFNDYVWRNDVPDPAVLYNPEGEEVSRFP